MAVRIVGAGIACLDYIVAAPQVPWGDTAHVSAFCIQGGGLVATALVACARLGAETTLYSLLGDDEITASILAELHEENVGTQGVRKIPGGASPFSFIHVNEQDGERTIFHRPGQNLTWPADERFPHLENADAMLVDHCYPDLALAAVNEACARNVPVIADTEPEEKHHAWLEGVNVLIAPHHFADRLGFTGNPEKALAAIHAFGPDIAVITLGSKGWVCSDGTNITFGKAFPVNVVDTLGAGDVFHGAFAFGWAQHWDAPRCCEFASAVAALKCTKPGGRAGIPDLATTLEFIEKNK
ncbi:MAG TPA: PfkB family carbohydrate kinase [Candidatus Hydrogenedentes bacterium]|nr:PfkB family carbohydrate kinase [Candidatus Hydrogenedentota bacterium]